MTHRSGTGPIELAILHAAGTQAAASPYEYVAGHYLLPVIEQNTGLGPRYAYDALLDLARPWVIPMPLISVHGNMGDRDFPALAPRHMECRPSHAGQMILDAEAGRLAPVPAGLINGTSYRGGTQPTPRTRPRHHHPAPPDRPSRRHRPRDPRPRRPALPRHRLHHHRRPRRPQRRPPHHPPPDRTDHPHQPTRPRKRPRPQAPATRDHPTATREPAHLYAWTSSAPDEESVALAHLIIETLPPGTSPGDICHELANHQAIAAHDHPRHPATIPIGDLNDAGTDRHPIRIAITLLPGTNPDTARDQIAGLDGITTQEPAAYPAPLATLLRTWTHQHRNEDITTSLTELHHAIQRDRDHEDD